MTKKPIKNVDDDEITIPYLIKIFLFLILFTTQALFLASTMQNWNVCSFMLVMFLDMIVSLFLITKLF